MTDLEQELLQRWKGALLDWHNPYHGGDFATCQNHRCAEYRYVVDRLKE